MTKKKKKEVTDFQSTREEITMMTVVIMFWNDSGDDGDYGEDGRWHEASGLKQ